VARGRVVRWEEGAGDSGDAPIEREIAGVEECWIADWHEEDGTGFSWHDIESSVVALAGRMDTAGAELRHVYTSTLPRVDFVAGLVGRGVWCTDLNWRDLQWAAAYRNFAALADADL